MNDRQDISGQIDQITQLLRDKLGIRGADLKDMLAKAQRRLPRQVYKAGQRLVDVQPLVQHPKLRLTVDETGLKRSADIVRQHLEDIDLTERRKDMLLGMAGSIAFSLLAVFGLLVWFLVWRGYL